MIDNVKNKTSMDQARQRRTQRQPRPRRRRPPLYHINITSFNSLSESGPSLHCKNVTLVSSLTVLGTTRLNNYNTLSTFLSTVSVSGTPTLNNAVTL
jgi:hypothetical protein